jgi:undecaprenyl-diphosphatase
MRRIPPRLAQEHLTFRIALVAALVLVALAGCLRAGAGAAFDRQVLLAMRAPETGRPAGPAWLPSVAGDLTALGSAAVLIPLSLLVAAWLHLRREPIAAVGSLVAGLGAYAASTGLKHLCGRVRPNAITHLVEVSSPSFPSGHAAASAACYLMIALLLVSGAAGRPQRRLALGAAAGVIVVVGASRVYLGVHYPMDVVAGWATGVAWALLWVAAVRRFAHRGSPAVAAGVE